MEIYELTFRIDGIIYSSDIFATWRSALEYAYNIFANCNLEGFDTIDIKELSLSYENRFEWTGKHYTFVSFDKDRLYEIMKNS